MKKTCCTFVNKMIYFEFNDGANRDKLHCYLFEFEFVLFSSFAAVKTPTHFLVFFDCLNAMLGLERQGWGDLLHVFERVKKWSKDWRCHSRIAWLSYYEMPFHAWCISTFSKFASLTRWGNFIRMGSDTQAMKSFNRGNIMVITNQRGRIDELVNLQVGNQFYPIRVIEVESSVLTNQTCYCKVLESSSKEEMDSRPNCSTSSQKEEFSECSRKMNLQ
ncbi:hypothetical protein Golob_007532 [Gossypium lobatum]|uniref:DUF4283 domain-containing protein n=1 Tax=Gossypium lobatum TaxID=34289 RepID=A0A7J8MCX5_9ROSI|nr:hypothetical protein [Gossypium lobatum]